MRITEVALKNIKSYEQQTISFPRGTIAISGPNGAGKSTILEAIGFALFDYLPYRNQREFMRHNATEADVRVSFISRLDECEYQAVRTLKRTTGSAESVTSNYYVHNFDTQKRVAQQKQDVQEFLRAHIGLDDYDDLARVFDNVLGVPQGRLTADFMLRPAQRKDTFDPLLRVDAYRHAYEKLRDVLDVMQGNISEQERRVSALEPDAARLPDQRAALAQYEKELAGSSAQAHALAARREELQRELQQRETQRRSLEQQRDLTRQLAQQEQHLRKRVLDEQAQVEAAQVAARQIAGAAAGFAAYREAQAALAALEVERNAADALRRDRQTIERKLVALATQQDALKRGVAESKAAAAQRKVLEPQVAAQERLEAQLREFSQDLDRVRQYGQQVSQMLRRLAANTPDEKFSFATEPLPVAADVNAASVYARLLEQYESLQEVGQWIRQRAEYRQRHKQNQAERKGIAEAVARCRSFIEPASRLPNLEEEYQSVQEKISAYQAQRRFNEQSQRMAKDGRCPFFQDQCPKVEDGQSLIPVIATLIRDYADQTVAAQAERDKLESAVAHARAAQQEANRLTDLEPRLQQLEQESRYLNREEQRLTQGIAARLKKAWRPQAIAERLALLAESEERLGQELEALGDPRRQAERLYSAANEFEQRALRLVAVSEEKEDIGKQLAQIDKQLEPYADLDSRITAQRQRLVEHDSDHDTYLRFQETAADLPRREQAVTALSTDMQEAARAVTESQRLLEEREADWEPAALLKVQADLSAAQSQLGAANERIRQLRAQIAQSQQEVAKLAQAAAELGKAKLALVAAQEVRTVTSFLRNVIRDAGPHITRHLIQQVSAEANTLFSEIMGDASAELSLTEEYEIQLEQHGHRRAFAQLSGGEQMSAALAVRLGLLRQISDLDIAFFDEPTQNMDAERRHNLAEQLERVTGFHQLFVISHDDTFEPMVSTVLRVRKENGVSTVEVE